MIWLSLLVALASPTLESLIGLLTKYPAWEANFSQTFVPVGFSTGAEEKGVFTFSHPSRLRFDYASHPKRIFALDGAQARLLDVEMRTCQTYTLGEGAWAALPLVALTDPGAMAQLFVVEGQAPTIVLRPRKEIPEVAKVELVLGDDGLPRQLTVVDLSGNENRFSFWQWRTRKKIESRFFSPSLPGGPPCTSGETQTNS
ncbi:MAG: LolA family protein [Thermoanaerobaculaceae bacterium]